MGSIDYFLRKKIRRFVWTISWGNTKFFYFPAIEFLYITTSVPATRVGFGMGFFRDSRSRIPILGFEIGIFYFGLDQKIPKISKFGHQYSSNWQVDLKLNITNYNTNDLRKRSVLEFKEFSIKNFFIRNVILYQALKSLFNIFCSRWSILY